MLKIYGWGGVGWGGWGGGSYDFSSAPVPLELIGINPLQPLAQGQF